MVPSMNLPSSSRNLAYSARSLRFMSPQRLYSMPLSDILTFLIAGYLIYKTYHELNYHIALDSGVIGIEKCAEIMESLV